MSIRQEVTLDFNSFRNLLLRLGKEYFDDTSLRQAYHHLIEDLIAYHCLCIDKKIGDGNSEWIIRLKTLFKELEDVSKFAYGLEIKKMVHTEISNLLLSEQNPRYTSSKTDISDICIDIAQQSTFKVIVGNSLQSVSDLMMVDFDHFHNGFQPISECPLLRDKKNVHFNSGDSLNLLEFLHPYVYYSNSIVITDKSLFKYEEHKSIIDIILGYMKEPKNITIKTQYSDKKDNNVKKIISYLVQKHRSVSFNLINNNRAHPRTIRSDYACIELTHTLDSLEITNNKIIATNPITFSIELKK